MRIALFAVLLGLPGLASAGNYSIKDEGGFFPQGHRVEFADRFGWRSYKVEFDFGLDQTGAALTRDSKLKVTVVRRDGRSWTYTCRGKDKEPLSANINYIYGKGISVVADCRIPEKEFAKAVDLHHEDVGLPSLVFQAMIKEGEVTPGAARGVYFVPAGQIASSEINAYAAHNDDPTSLAVVFHSATGS